MRWTNASGREWEIFEVLPFGIVRIRTTDHSRVGDVQASMVRKEIYENKALADVFEKLPKCERTLLKHFREYPFKLDNSEVSTEYDIILGGKRIGMVKYYRGRKLCVYSIAEPATTEAR